MHPSKQPNFLPSSVKSEEIIISTGYGRALPSIHELNPGHAPVIAKIANRDLRMRRKTAKKGDSRQQGVVDDLPEELVESILCRIPFPVVFKVRLLAKEWLYKFLASPSESLNPSFPRLISSVSSQWNKYCPVISTQKDSLLCFDQSSLQWRQMPMFSNLPEQFHSSVPYLGVRCYYATSASASASASSSSAFCGSMYCFYRFHEVMVCNTITKAWRKLPELPKLPLTTRFCCAYVKMLAANSGTYKVSLEYRLDNGDYNQAVSRISHIYDSKSGIWIEVVHDRFSTRREEISIVHISARMYCLMRPKRFNIEKKTEDGFVLILQTYSVENDSWLKAIYLHLPWSRSFAAKIKDMSDAAKERILDRILVSNCVIFKCKDKVVLVVWLHDHQYDIDIKGKSYQYSGIGLLGSRPDTIQIYHLEASEIDLYECDFDKKLNRMERKLVLDWPQGTDDAAASDLYDSYETIDKLFPRPRSIVDFSADDNFIYVVSHERYGPNKAYAIYPQLRAYHVKTGTWSRIPSPPSNPGQVFLRGLAFEPGLYPFMAV